MRITDNSMLGCYTTCGVLGQAGMQRRLSGTESDDHRRYVDAMQPYQQFMQTMYFEISPGPC